MILLLPAEYSLKTNTEEINMTTQTQEQINQNCVETNSSYAFKTTNPDCKERKLFDLVRSGGHTAIDLIAAERYDALEWYKARASYLEKRVAELEEKRPKQTCPQDEDLTGGDANYEYYYTNTDDGEMTIWKVPRHLAEIKSSTPYNWDNAVAECFRDEKFGENWDKLNYLIVREMKLKDLVKRKWKPAAEKPKEEDDDLCGCAECEKCPSHINPYEWAEATHGDEDEEEEYDPLVMRGEDCDGYECGNKLTTEEECRQVMCKSCINIWKGFEKDGVPCELRHDLGAAIYAARNASEDEEELNSEDDDYEDKMDGKWKCRRCGENKASSVVFKGGDCLNYCRECLDELEENSEIEKGGDAANYQYKWM